MSEKVTVVLSDDLYQKIESEESQLGLNKSEVIRNHLARSISEV